MLPLGVGVAEVTDRGVVLWIPNPDGSYADVSGDKLVPVLGVGVVALIAVADRAVAFQLPYTGGGPCVDMCGEFFLSTVGEVGIIFVEVRGDGSSSTLWAVGIVFVDVRGDTSSSTLGIAGIIFVGVVAVERGVTFRTPGDFALEDGLTVGDNAAACWAWVMASLTAVNGVGSSMMRSSITDTTSLTFTGVSTRGASSCGSSA